MTNVFIRFFGCTVLFLFLLGQSANAVGNSNSETIVWEDTQAVGSTGILKAIPVHDSGFCAISYNISGGNADKQVNVALLTQDNYMTWSKGDTTVLDYTAVPGSKCEGTLICNSTVPVGASDVYVMVKFCHALRLFFGYELAFSTQCY